MNTVHGMIAFLRCEADAAEARAKQLRLTAALVQANQQHHPAEPNKKKRKKGESANAQFRDATSSSSAAINDAETQPEHDPYSLGYTCFLQSCLQEIKKQPSARDDASGAKDSTLAALAQKWTDSGELEKKAWQKRAEQIQQATEHHHNDQHRAVAMAAAAAAVAVTGGHNSLGYEDEDEDDDEVNHRHLEDVGLSEPLVGAEDEDDWGDRKRPASKKTDSHVQVSV